MRIRQLGGLRKRKKGGDKKKEEEKTKGSRSSVRECRQFPQDLVASDSPNKLFHGWKTLLIFHCFRVFRKSWDKNLCFDIYDEKMNYEQNCFMFNKDSSFYIYYYFLISYILYRSLMSYIRSRSTGPYILNYQ